VTPSWYDLLDVDPTATPEEIRAAWKNAVEGLDPTDRRFKSLNRAAEVLLDPERRAAHDADLAAQESEADLVDEVEEEPAPAEPVVLTKRSADPEAEEAPERSAPANRWRLTAILGLVAAVLLAAAAVSAWRGGDSDRPDQDDIAEAVGAAEAAVAPVLSYDYQDMDASKTAALPYLTKAYGEEFERNLDGYLRDAAAQTKTVVDAEFVASGVVRTGHDLVDVLVFVNRPTTKNGEDTIVYKDYVTLRMTREDDAWLLDCLVVALPDGSNGDCDRD